MAGKEKDVDTSGSEEITTRATISNSPPSTTIIQTDTTKVDAEASENLSNPTTTNTNVTTTSSTATNSDPETISCILSSNTGGKEWNGSDLEEINEGQLLSTTSAGISLIKLYSDSSTSSSSSESDSEEEDTTQSLDHRSNIDEEDDTEDCNNFPVGCGNRKYGYPMIAGEVDYRDLSPPKDAAPSLSPSVTLSPIGFVMHTIEQLTIIESYPNQPTIDEGTHLWSSEREYIGELFETIGPVKRPFYTIRMSNDEETHTLSPGKEIFIAKDEENFTKYVLEEKLKKEKWSDASWKNDGEVPPELQEPSDDEEERNRAGKGSCNKDKMKNKNNRPFKQQGSLNQRYNINTTTMLPPPCPPHPPPTYFSFPPVLPPFPMSSLPPPPPLPFNFPPLPPPPLPPPPLPPPSLPLPPSLPPPPPGLLPYTVRQAFHNNNNNRTQAIPPLPPPPPPPFQPSFNNTYNSK